ncbi:MAG: site-specific integrase [Actinobacteria bacterium]|nr:site-specific integrase [Actinomycetota bacterium]MCL5882601.1 site-specific integrase [Actinomycetota bacterium]
MNEDREYGSDDAGVYYIVGQDGRGGASRAKRKLAGEDSWTVARLWDEYQAANPGLKGMRVYRDIYNAHLQQLFGVRQPSEITPFDVDRLKLVAMKGKSPKSVANALELLRRIVNFGVKRDLCAGPRFKIQLPRVSNEKTEDLTEEELARLVRVIDHHLSAGTRYAAGAAMMKLVLFTGMRRGEIFRLKWSDLDFHRNNILLREPKGGRDVIIPMSSQARSLFEDWRVDAGDGCGKCCGSGTRGGNAGGSAYVFPGKDGGQRRDIRAQVNAIKREAGLPRDFRPLHGLRHVFASNLISRGVEFQIVQRLLTHRGGTVTHRYAHIRDDALRAAAELAGQLL